MAAALLLAHHHRGAYEVSASAPLALALLLVAALGATAGFRPSRPVAIAAGLLVLLGGWTIASVAWGGLPNDAWTSLNGLVAAAAALAIGSAAASSPTRGRAVAIGVLGGSAALAAVMLVRLAADEAPADWFEGRVLAGPVGYHNAQAAVFALALPVALWAATSRLATGRAAGGAAAATLVAALLLTQSRGVILVAALAGIVLQVAVARSTRSVLAVVSLALVAAGLLAAVRPVDEQLLVGTSADRIDALRAYVLAALAAALALALAWVLLPKLRAARVLATVGASVLLAGAVGLAVVERETFRRELAAVSTAPRDDAPATSPGSTRLASLATNGRREAWRVAVSRAEAEPLIGDGEARFARAWGKERRLAGLYVLQPHSLLLELLAELGAVGLALFLLFVASATVALLRARDRALAAAGLATLTIVVLQASLDWTWSFPSIIAATLLVVGAGAGSGRGVSLRPAARVAVPVACVLAIVSVGVPYLADRHLAAGLAEEGSDAAEAATRAAAARKLDPWLAPAASLAGRVVEGAGATARAAAAYGRAAELSQQPWVDGYRQARALAAAGRRADAFAVCRRVVSSNPAAPELVSGPCASGSAGNAWPVESAAPTRAPYSAFVRDLDCAACDVDVKGGAVVASVVGGADAQDSAYAVREIGGRAGVDGSVTVAATVRLSVEDGIAGNVALLQARDVRNALVWEVYVADDDSTIRLWSPAGALGARQLNATTAVRLDADGSRARRVEVTARRGRSVEVRVDGRRRIAISDLGPAATGPIRFVRLGVVASGAERSVGRTQARLHAVRVADARR